MVWVIGPVGRLTSILPEPSALSIFALGLAGIALAVSKAAHTACDAPSSG